MSKAPPVVIIETMVRSGSARRLAAWRRGAIAARLLGMTVAMIACCCAGSGFAASSRSQRGAEIAVSAVAGQPRLISYAAGEHARFDRVVFLFSAGLPSRRAQYVSSVSQDASGKPVPLQGRAFLLVTLMNVNWTPPNVPTEPTLTSHLAVLRQLKPAGVFEGYYSFGLGLSRRVAYRFFVLHHPDRLVLDLYR
jgi:hypothetical protein